VPYSNQWNGPFWQKNRHGVGLGDEVDDARVEVTIVAGAFDVVDAAWLVEEEDRINEEEADLMVEEGMAARLNDVAPAAEEEAGLGVGETETRADDDPEPSHLPKRGLQPVPQ
jgi:hypothetical protein